MTLCWTMPIYLFQLKIASTKRKESLWFLLVLNYLWRCKSLSDFRLCLSWPTCWEVDLVLQIRKQVWEHQGAHPTSMPKLPSREREGRQRRRKKGRRMNGAHKVSSSSEVPPGFPSLNAAWDSNQMKFYTGNKRKRWKRMPFPWWQWKIKCLIRKNAPNKWCTGWTACAERHSALRKLPTEKREVFYVHWTLERGFIYSSDRWWVTGFVHQTLRFLFLVYS